MDCSLCKKKGVYENEVVLCKDHFIKYFENKVEQTIQEYGLVKKSDNVAVAVSGGKDSLVVLYFLHSKGYNVTALLIDEGIKGYREKTIIDMKEFCSSQNIPYIIRSFQKDYTFQLDEITFEPGKKPCTVCGVFRRNLLNKAAKGFSVLVTGHNLDDEAQAVLMNTLKNNTDVAQRGGPRSGTSSFEGFVQRVKPLYFCTEQENRLYALLRGIHASFSECPHAHKGFRFAVREALNELESKHSGSKRNVLNRFLVINKTITSGSIKTCKRCNEPSKKEVCRACIMLDSIQK